MIEPEIAFADLDDNAELAEDFLRAIFRAVLDERPDDMAFFAERIDKTCIARLEAFVSASFERMAYTEAIEALEKSKRAFEFPVRWGIDLQSEHERYLTEKLVGRPVVVMDYPKAIKAFYMRLNDDGKTVAAMDVLVPGIGEIIGGSQREERLDVLDARIDEMRPRSAGLLVVPRPAALRHRAARRLRPRVRAGDRLRHRHGQHPRRDPVPADAEERGVLTPARGSRLAAGSSRLARLTRRPADDQAGRRALRCGPEGDPSSRRPVAPEAEAPFRGIPPIRPPTSSSRTASSTRPAASSSRPA